MAKKKATAKRSVGDERIIRDLRSQGGNAYAKRIPARRKERNAKAALLRKNRKLERSRGPQLAYSSGRAVGGERESGILKAFKDEAYGAAVDGAQYVAGGARNLAGGLGKLLTLPFGWMSDLLSAGSDVGRWPTNAAKRGAKRLREGNPDGYVTVKRKDLERLEHQLAALDQEDMLHPRPVRGGGSVNAEELAEALHYVRSHPTRGSTGRRKHYVEVAAAILFLGTSLFFLDKASVTGYAVTAATGTSLAGYYSLIGFVFLGVATLVLAYQGKRH